MKRYGRFSGNMSHAACVLRMDAPVHRDARMPRSRCERRLFCLSLSHARLADPTIPSRAASLVPQSGAPLYSAANSRRGQ